MNTSLLGLHHITAIVDDPQENIDFYTHVLGLRLVKQTVNFDDPYTYHLYYGDDTGRPGTIVTFFPWPGARHGSRGTGQISAIAFAVPAGSLLFWQERLTDFGIRFSNPEDRFGNLVLSLYDPSGLLLELAERPFEELRSSVSRGGVPAEVAIQGLFGVTLTVAQVAPSADFLTDLLGFRAAEDSEGRARFILGKGVDTAVVDLMSRPDVSRGQLGVGSIHHVAWRVADDVQLLEWQDALTRQGVGVTPVRERQYFRSIYFREPGGVLFEIATDAPGFAIDETLTALGTQLMLPPWLEEQREEIERHLPPITVPEAPSVN